MFPTKPVTTNEPVKRVDKKFQLPGGPPKLEYVPGDKITPEMRAAYPPNYFGDQ